MSTASSEASNKCEMQRVDLFQQGRKDPSSFSDAGVVVWHFELTTTTSCTCSAHVFFSALARRISSHTEDDQHGRRILSGRSPQQRNHI